MRRSPDTAALAPERSRATDAERAAAAVALERFGIRGRARALPGECDLNFLVAGVADPPAAREGGGPERRIVLKVGAPSRRDACDLAVSALERLEGASLSAKTPRVVPPVSARDGSSARSANVDFLGRPRVAIATTYLDGIALADLRPRSMHVLASLGRLLAEMGLAWDGFDHPALDRDFPWRMETAPATVRARLDALDEEDRRLVAATLDRATRQLDGSLGALPRGVLHNDANDHNVLATPSLDGAELAGLIDFGDVVRGWRATEVAVAATYAMMGLADPVEAACAVARGYAAAAPLTALECRAVVPLAAMRLCLSIAVQTARMRERPDNEHLAVSQEPARALLDRLARLDWRLATFRIRDACGLAPNPDARAVAAWIRRARPRAPVMAPETLMRPCALDLSVTSPEVRLDPDAGPAAAERWVRRKLAAEDATVGVGRYDEVRLLYDDPAFRSRGDRGPESRTVHMGLDLFVPAGTPVYAPLAGTVVRSEDRTRPLDYGPTVVLRHVAEDGTGFHTLYGHLDRATLERSAIGRQVRPGDVLGWVGDASVNGGWPPHLHLQTIAVDPLDGDGGDEGRVWTRGVALHRLRTVWRSAAPDPTPLAGLPEGALAEGEGASGDRGRAESLAERRRRALGPSLSLSYSRPLRIVRGRGAYLYDDAGRDYLDTVNNVAHVGHCNRRVADAIARQARVLNTNTRYLHREVVRLAEELLALLPAPLEVVHFVCSGSEANELALRMARAYTGRDGVICLEGGYHGNTAALVEASPYKFDGPGGAGASRRVAVAARPDPYRGKFREAGPDDGDRREEDDGTTGRESLGEAYAAQVARAATRLERSGVAAFLAEPILSCGGQIEPPPGYLAAAYVHARAAGAVAIADEVQVGFGRVGDAFWGFELQGVVPDVVTLGKPMGNGHPIAAVVTTREIADAFANGMEYFNSFGGNPVSCAAARAVLTEIRERDLVGRARDVGAALTSALRDLARRRPLIGDVRGRGLFLGVELVRDRRAREPFPEAGAYIAERARELGVLLSVDGPDRNVLKIKPPMVFSEADAERTVETLDAIMGDTVLQDPSR